MKTATAPGTDGRMHGVVVVHVAGDRWMASCWCGWDTYPHRYGRRSDADKRAIAHASEAGVTFTPTDPELLQLTWNSPTALGVIPDEPANAGTIDIRKEPTMTENTTTTVKAADPKRSEAAKKAAATRAAKKAAGGGVVHSAPEPKAPKATKAKAEPAPKKERASAYAAHDGVKLCGRCKKEKSVSEYAKNKARRDGLSSLCRTCDAEYSKEYRAAKKAAAGSKQV